MHLVSLLSCYQVPHATIRDMDEWAIRHIERSGRLRAALIVGIRTRYPTTPRAKCRKGRGLIRHKEGAPGDMCKVGIKTSPNQYQTKMIK